MYLTPEHDLFSFDEELGHENGVPPQPGAAEPGAPVPVPADDYQQESAAGLAREPAGAPALALLPDPPLSLALLELAASLVGSKDGDELVGAVLPRLVDALPIIEKGVVWLHDPRTGKLRVAAVVGFDDAPGIVLTLESWQPAPGEGLAGRAFNYPEPLLIQTEQGYSSLIDHVRPGYEPLIARLDEHFAAHLTAICVPLRANDEPLGVLELLCPVPPESASEDWWPETHLPFLSQTLATFGRLVAAAIHNKQLYSQSLLHRQRLDAFDAVVTAISTATDLPDMLRSVLDVMLGLLPVSSGAILLLDPIQARLRLGPHQGLPADYVAALANFPVSGSPCEEVVRYGQPMLRPLLQERNEQDLLASGLESCAYLPLLAGGTVVGVLGLYGGTTLYKEIDMTRLMPLGNQVGFAIANVRLYEESYLERYKLNTVINSIAEGVVLCDSQGRLVLANGAAMELFSLDAVPYQQPLSEMPDFYGIRDVESDRPLPVERLPMARALSGETFHDYRVLLHGVSGDDSVMSFSGAPVHADNDAIEGAVVIFRDITANQKLERAKDEFLAVAAHELRSPLAAVRSYAEMLLQRKRQRTESDARDLHGLTILSQQVTHMLRMVDNLLDVSRLDAGQLDLQLQHIDLVGLATQVLDQQRPTSPEHELVLESEQPELWIDCDTIRIRQVLTNLVSNATKYSPPNTKVTVRMAIRAATGNRVSQQADEEFDERHDQMLSIELGQSAVADMLDAAGSQPIPTREALVCVSDQGGGIQPEQQTRLFERFYRVKDRRAEGLGLGLYLSRQFVVMHGGHIWVESVEGVGSTFCFTLPLRGEGGGAS